MTGEEHEASRTGESERDRVTQQNIIALNNYLLEHRGISIPTAHDPDPVLDDNEISVLINDRSNLAEKFQALDECASVFKWYRLRDPDDNTTDNNHPRDALDLYLNPDLKFYLLTPEQIKFAQVVATTTKQFQPDNLPTPVEINMLADAPPELVIDFLLENTKSAPQFNSVRELNLAIISFLFDVSYGRKKQPFAEQAQRREFMRTVAFSNVFDQRIIDAYSQLNRGVTAEDLGLKSYSAGHDTDQSAD